MHKTLVKIGRVVAEIWLWTDKHTHTQTDRQTDRQTRSLQYSALVIGCGVINWRWNASLKGRWTSACYMAEFLRWIMSVRETWIISSVLVVSALDPRAWLEWLLWTWLRIYVICILSLFPFPSFLKPQWFLQPIELIIPQSSDARPL